MICLPEPLRGRVCFDGMKGKKNEVEPDSGLTEASEAGAPDETFLIERKPA